MTINEYQQLAQRTSNTDLTQGEHLLNGALGLCGEAGEVADLIKKATMQGHVIDRVRVCEELGDVCWYLAETATALGESLESIMTANIAKLRRRYPEGFDAERSKHREGKEND